MSRSIAAQERVEEGLLTSVVRNTFRKEVPTGAMEGGGGHVYLRGNRNYWTLLHLKYERHIMATNGESGSAKRSSGKDGEDRVIEVPCGTVVYDAETGEFICDVTEDGSASDVAERRSWRSGEF